MNGFDLSTISSIYVGSTQYSLIYIGSDKIWPTTPIPHNYSLDYFTIESLLDSNTIKIGKAKSPSNISLSYSTDNGTTWTDLTISAARDLVTINTGDKVIFKGTNNKLASAWDTYYKFNSNKDFKVYGNVMSLLNGDNFISNSEFTNGSDTNLCGLFYGTTTLIDAGNLILPATTCMSNCYNGMFRGCTNLTTAPLLLATTSAYGCCSSMFEGCINLEEAPEINFTSLSEECCQRMFCMDRNSRITTPKMTKSPILRCATGVTNCYKEMFKGNGNLIEITCLLTNDSNATVNWAVNVSTTGTLYKSPLKTNWTSNSTSNIPPGWTAIDYVES